MEYQYKYTSDGRKVAIIEILNSNETVVQEVYISKGKEVLRGDKFIAKSLKEEPVLSWKEKRIKDFERNYDSRIKKLETDLSKSQKQLSIAIAKARVKTESLMQFAKNSDSSQLDTLKMFLSGETKYFAFTRSFAPCILSASDDRIFDIDTYGYGNPRIDGQKLISVIGSSNGDLEYRIHSYRDGSGGWQEIVPCRNKEEAVAVMQSAFNKLCDNYLENERCSLYLEKWQAIEGIAVPKKVLKKYKQQQFKNTKNRINKLKEDLTKAELELESIDK